MKRPVFAALTLFLSAAGVEGLGLQAQVALFSVPSAGDLRRAGDYDGDGVSDLLTVSAYSVSAIEPGRVWSGRDGTLLATFPQMMDGESVGDVDGDGRSDLAYIFGSTAAMQVGVLVGGETRWATNAAWGPFAVLGDLDQDGVREVAANCQILDGRTGAVIRTFPFGGISDAGDVDGDGVPDVIAGGEVHSTVTGAALITFSALSLPGSPHFGADAAYGIGDTDGDGFDDILLYDFYIYHGEYLLAGGPRGRFLDGETWASYLASASRLGDVNADGRDEFLLSQFGSCKWGCPGFLYLTNSLAPAGRWAWLRTSDDGGARSVVALDAMGSLFAVSGNWTPAYVYSTAPAPRAQVVSVGTVCLPGQTSYLMPELFCSDPLITHGELRFDVYTAGSSGWLLAGSPPVQPNHIGYGCFSYLESPVVLAPFVGTYWFPEAVIPIPFLQSLAGVGLRFQALIVEPASSSGFAVSNALDVQLGFAY